MTQKYYAINPGDKPFPTTVGTDCIVEATATTAAKRVEVRIDWDSLTTDSLSGQAARLAALNLLQQIKFYIEQTGKFNAAA